MSCGWIVHQIKGRDVYWAALKKKGSVSESPWPGGGLLDILGGRGGKQSAPCQELLRTEENTVNGLGRGQFMLT